MLNLNELESRWFQYKLKSYIPHSIILLSLIVITVVIISFDFSTPEKNDLQVATQEVTSSSPEVIINEPKQAELAPSIVIQKANEINHPLSKEISSSINKPLRKNVIQPSFGFINNFKNNAPEYYQDNIPVTQIYTKPVKKEIVLKEKVVVQAPKVEAISIKRQNTHEDIQHVIQRFKKSNNPALSLFAAKKYYELGNYNQAYNYALITNELNNDIEGSWIIFIKSLVKLGKKEKAIEILKKYISNSHSQRATILLDNIRLGKI